MNEKETEQIREANCLNCDEPLDGEYCRVCGQPSSTQRYTFASLASEVYAQIRKVETAKTITTSLALTLKPGEFVRNYLGGKRVGFINPVRFFFFAFFIEVTVKFVAMWILPSNPIVASVQSGFRLELVNFGFTVIWGILWAALYYKNDLTFIEYIIAAIYFVSQTFIFSALWLLLMLPFSTHFESAPIVYSVFDLAIYYLYSCFFAYRFFQTTLLSLIWKQFVILVVFIGLVWTAYRMGLI
jgi:hypothetical protein